MTAAGADLAGKGLDELKTRLDALRVVLERSGDRLTDGSAAFGLTERVAGERRQEKPDKLSLRGFLTAIAEEAKPVAEIVGSAMALKDLVMSVF